MPPTIAAGIKRIQRIVALNIPGQSGGALVGIGPGGRFQSGIVFATSIGFPQPGQSINWPIMDAGASIGCLQKGH